MKKILALALVLVLALGMMTVPVSAKVQFDGTSLSSYANDYTLIGDIYPDYKEKFYISFSHFDLSTDAANALTAALTPNNVQGVMNKIAKTAGVRVRTRKGGQIMTVSAKDPVYIATSHPTPAAVAAAYGDTVANIGGPTNADVVSAAAFGKFIDNLVFNFPIWKGEGERNLRAAYAEAEAAVMRANLADWWYCFELKAPEIPWVSVEEVDFEFEVLIDVDGRSDNGWYWTFVGTLMNDVVEVDADTFFANGYDGHIIKATEYVPKIAICGNYDDDVFAHVKMANEKKIFFVATTTGEIKDEPIFDKYPSIEWAYTIYQIGLNSYSGNIIELGGVDSTYYVYGKNADGSLKYLGRGGELMPLSAKYYISSQKLDLADDVVDEEDLPEEEVPAPASYNPSTGI